MLCCTTQLPSRVGQNCPKLAARCCGVILSQGRQPDIPVHLLQCLSDQGNLSNLTSFLNNTVLFVVAGTHVINLTHSALAGNVGKCAATLAASRLQPLPFLLGTLAHAVP